jgi:tetratricopeptide (TPR) repeat protein
MVSLQMVARAENRADEAARLLAEGQELARALPGGDDPGLACMLHVQALSLREAGRPAEAERLAREAVAMHHRTRKPNDLELAHGLAEWGRCLLALKRYAEAEAPVKEALAIFRVHLPDSHATVASARIPLLEILRGQGKAAETDRNLADRNRDPLTPDRRDLTGWLTWAEAREAAGQWELAWQGYSEAARLAGPADRGARVRIGNGLLAVVNAGPEGRLRPEEAVTAARQAVAILEQALTDDAAGAVAIQEALANGLSLLGKTLADLDRHPEAAEAYRKSVAQWRVIRAAGPPGARPHRDHGYTTLRLSESLLKADRPEEATAAAREALRLHVELLAGTPGNETYQYRLGWAYGALINALESQGKLAEAVNEVRAALRTQLDTASARRYVAGVMEVRAYALANDPDVGKRDPGRAIKLAKAALEVVPEHADCWNTLGVAYYRAGEWEEAIVALQKCRELDDQWSNPFFLAKAHWQLGHKDEARRWYDKGIKWIKRWGRTNPSLIRFRGEAAQLLVVAGTND